MSAIKPFAKLGIKSTLLSSITELGYETPTPIQEKSIPILMQSNDLLAQAQTGTGKTAAFALPILSLLDIKKVEPQALIITPTRELAIQVAEAFQSYARHIKGFHVAPIYGGQDYRTQHKALKRGVHIIVGTPGRVMDHFRRGTISVNSLKTVVLDEADEMLNMGFIKDIEWILEQIPHEHQTALFSATMPASIHKIAKRYLKNAQKIEIKTKGNTVDSIKQYYIRVSNNQKLDILTRFLEVEEIQAAIIFARTKNSSSELAEKLQARGHTAAALNGDMNQSAREKVIGKLKDGSLDIVVATDVAARGINVERMSHVINYDIPHDTESYIHRIGRTGRAGRAGKALLFVTQREQRLLNDIERFICKKIEQLEPPSNEEMKEIRNKQLSDKIINVLKKSKKLGPCHEIVASIMEQTGYAPVDIAAAFAYLLQQSKPTTTTSETESSDRKPSKDRYQPSRFKRDSSGKSGNKRRSFSSSSKSSKEGGNSRRKPSSDSRRARKKSY